MKNLFFVLVFMLVGSFAFANSSELIESSKYTLTVYTSCGETGVIIVQDEDTIADVIEWQWIWKNGFVDKYYFSNKA